MDTSNSFKFLSNISQSVMSYDFKFDTIAISCLLKSLNGLDRENGAHTFPESSIFSLDFFLNISRTNLRLKFDPISCNRCFEEDGFFKLPFRGAQKCIFSKNCLGR